MRGHLIALHTQKILRLQCKIALQDNRLDNPAFIQCSDQQRKDRDFLHFGDIPFHGSSPKLILLRTITIEARTSTFTSVLKSDSIINFHSL